MYQIGWFSTGRDKAARDLLEVVLASIKRGEIKAEHIPALIKRCPKCSQLSLEFDPKTGIIRCIKCGFEERLPMFKE